MQEPSISSAMMIRILDIDGSAPSKKALAEMSMRDRSALRQEMLRVDAGIDTTIESRLRFLRDENPHPTGGRTLFFIPRSSLVRDAFFLAYGGLHWEYAEVARLPLRTRAAVRRGAGEPA